MAATEATNPCLERLSGLDSIVLNQRVSDRKGNKYAVLSGEDILFDVIEEAQESGVFSGGNRRAFHMEGLDSTGEKVFSFRRPSMWLSDKIVLSMNDAVTSVVRMKPTALTPCFSINDAQDCPAYFVKGKLCTNASSYQLQTISKSTIGSIQKKHRGWRNELLSRNDDYVISFPADLAVHFKLAVIGACVLIDFRFHEYRRR
ncbi:hypothetical protein PYW07_006808 [Mythimna separata]|uniref:Phospholipid scramblase n=1 Tax=Mythimna separata TaxID=271217 RepID=A0AAD7Z0J7_MYTSE|nr:hypothetical protein PYW07_006808 [Mythimna separata]